jgi:acetyl esterase
VKSQLIRGATCMLLRKPLVGLVGRGRRNGVDTALDRQVAAVLELQRLLRVPAVESLDPARARVMVELGLSPFELAPAAMAEVIDTTAPHRTGPQSGRLGDSPWAGAIPVRIFVPRNARPHWIVYFHGGGGVIGSIRSAEATTRYIAARTGCTVASVGYRLGPEHRHPAAIEDAGSAWRALVARVPAGGRIAVAGDSFGGYLSTHVDRDARACGARPPDLQVLIYPMVDHTSASPSIRRYAEGYLLTWPMIEWFRSHYLGPNEDRLAVSPQFWPDLHGAAPAIVATAGFDPLVDEGDAYAAKLRAAGVEVRHRRYPSLVHGFLSLAGGVRAARAAIDEVCADIAELLG